MSNSIEVPRSAALWVLDMNRMIFTAFKKIERQGGVCQLFWKALHSTISLHNELNSMNVSDRTGSLSSEHW